MDPQVCLNELLKLFAADDTQSRPHDTEDEMVEKLDALSEWIRKGGFPPLVRERGINLFYVPTTNEI